MEPKHLTMEQIVGENVRQRRMIRDLSQEQLRVRLQENGIRMSRPTVAQMESGKRPLTVGELLGLGLALGVAPHLLLYPPPETDITIDAEHTVPGSVLTGWLWNPDKHPYTRAGEMELRVVSDSIGATRYLSEDQLKTIQREFLKQEIQKAIRDREAIEKRIREREEQTDSSRELRPRRRRNP